MYSYKKKKYVWYTVVFSLLSSIITFLLTYSVMKYDIFNVSNNNYNNSKISYEAEVMNGPNNNYQDTATDVFENAITSVVGISVLNVDTNSIFSKNTTTKLNMGSGIIVSNNGYMVTNQHVSGNVNDKVIVTLSNGMTYEGITKWVDNVLDLAIVKIGINNLNVAELGNSDEIKLGQTVYAIGNPLGFDFQRTITAGIVSALNRTIKTTDNNEIGYMEDLIQTDASINPGNSGGPLINSKGQVVGINTIKVNEAEGIGFAIPINIIKPILEKYITYDEFNEAYLGIFAYDQKLLKYLKSNISIDKGIWVANIDKFGPLRDSKLKVGDILLSIDNVDLISMVQLRKYLYSKKPLDNIVIKFANSNGIYSETITLSNKK